MSARETGLDRPGAYLDDLATVHFRGSVEQKAPGRVWPSFCIINVRIFCMFLHVDRIFMYFSDRVGLSSQCDPF